MLGHRCIDVAGLHYDSETKVVDHCNPGHHLSYRGVLVSPTWCSPRYLSQTLVLVEQQKVPESYLKAVVTEDLSGRLASMKEQITAGRDWQPIIERFNLFANAGLSMDDSNRPDQKKYRDHTDSVGDCPEPTDCRVLHLLQGQRSAYGPAGLRRDSVALRQRES